jgi:hypothetical protein
VLYSLFLLLSRGQQIIYKSLYCDSKTPTRIVCQDWNEVVACAVKIGTNELPFGQCRGHVTGCHAQGLFPLLTSGWTLVQPMVA